MSSRMDRFGYALLVTLTCGMSGLLSVSNRKLVAQSNVTPYATPLEWPGFVVDVVLSDKARQKLIERKETLRAFGYYSGVPKPGVVTDMGEVGLANFDVQFAVGSSAQIGKILLKRDAFEKTDKGTPMVLVNIVSGRKSSKNNLLDCGIFEEKADKIQNGHIPIACKLIGE